MSASQGQAAPWGVVGLVAISVACGDGGSPALPELGTSSSGADSTTGMVSEGPVTGHGSLDTTADPPTGGSWCGDGIANGHEDCDGFDVAGADCRAQGFEAGGVLTCREDCRFDTSMCLVPRCGNGIIEGIEHCDGNALEGASCQSLGFDDGSVFCSDDCILDTSMCIISSCGNDRVEAMEVCDGRDLVGENCISQGFDGGVLGCTPDCQQFESSGCFVCGNEVIDGVESCDGRALGGADCRSQGFMYGLLLCDDQCGFDLSNCSDEPIFCVESGQPIGPSRGAILSEFITVPPQGGFVADLDIAIDATHTFVGDLEIDLFHTPTGSMVRLLDHQCVANDDIAATFDQDALAGPDCIPPIAIEGTVLPAQSLHRWVGLPDPEGLWELRVTDTSDGDGGLLNWACITVQVSATDPNGCGDGIMTFTEECDGAMLGQSTCESLGFLAGGDLACDSTCHYDVTGCIPAVCGDSVIQAPEHCDGQEIAGATCAALGFVGGALGCTESGCIFETSECSNTVLAWCSTPAAPIDSRILPTESTITVPMGMNVLDVDVLVDIEHSYLGDIDMFLIHESTGTTVELTTDQCAGFDDVFAVFNDEASLLPDCVEPIGIEGNVQPEGSLASFDFEEIGGDWTLRITDDTGDDSGTLNEWCLYIHAG